MHRTMLPILALLLIVAALPACQTAKKEAALPYLEFPDGTVPMDATLAAGGVLAVMSGGEPSPECGVEFKPGASSGLAEKHFSFAGFNMTDNRLLMYAEAPAGRRAVGVMPVEDSWGRRAMIAYDVEYGIRDNALVIAKAEAGPIYTDEPEVELFMIPVDAMPEDMSGYAHSWEGLARLVREKGVRPAKDDPLAKERKDYLLVFMIRDRLGPDAKMKFSCEYQNSARAYPKVVLATKKQSNFNGWLVGFTGGEIAPRPKYGSMVQLSVAPDGKTWKTLIRKDLALLP